MKLNTNIIFEKKKSIIRNQNSKMNSNNKNENTYKLEACQSFDCVLESLKVKRELNANLFMPSKECIDIRFNLYDKLSKLKFNIKPNLTYTQLANMKLFLRDRPFSVIQSDKNVGLVILSNELLDSLCTTHLSDTKTYSKIHTNPLNDTIYEVKKILYSLQKEKQLNIDLSKLVPKVPRLGNFRVLAKLHKENFGIRPIINNKKHITSQICKLIDLIIKPVLYKTKTYLKDSQHLIQKCEDLNFNDSNLFLYTMDFESLYTNLNKADVVNTITGYIGDYLDTKYITTIAFRAILSIIFDLNVFSYKNKKGEIMYFKQINGIAMGCICGPSVASLFVFVLEEKWLKIHKPLYYGRFIDDICLIDNKKLNEPDFQSFFLGLKLNIKEDKVIEFLDLTIKFDVLRNRLVFSLFIKPTNTFSYLKIESNHPQFVFNNIPKSLFIRIRRICIWIIYISQEN